MPPLVRSINKLYLVRFLPFLSKGVALEIYSQLLLGTLEWRSENTLAELRIRQPDVIPVAPQPWNDWVEAFTAMFAPPNLLSNLCRKVATIRQGEVKHLGESLEHYAIKNIYIVLFSPDC